MIKLAAVAIFGYAGYQYLQKKQSRFVGGARSSVAPWTTMVDSGEIYPYGVGGASGKLATHRRQSPSGIESLHEIHYGKRNH